MSRTDGLNFMNVTPVVFVDLDDTLFHSARKRKDGSTRVAAMNTKKQPSAWMSPVQAPFFEWLSSSILIPCTGRGVSSCLRVTLPFSSWRICCFGGVILDSDGELCVEWDEELKRRFAHQEINDHIDRLESQTLAALKEHSIDARLTRIPAGTRHSYLCIKHNNIKTDPNALIELSMIKSLWSEYWQTFGLFKAGWMLYENENNLSTLSPNLQKSAAVRWLRERFFLDHWTVGIGDHISDCSFLQECDFLMYSTDSQIFKVWVAQINMMSQV